MMKEFKLTDLEGVGPVTVKKLADAGVKTPLDIVIRGTKEFSRISGLSMETTEKHLTTMKKMLAEDGNDIEVRDLASLRVLRKRQIKVPLHVEEVDEMLRGGVETQSLYEIYGEEGHGKTQFSMTTMAEYLGEGHGIMMIDCEGTFDEERFEEICKARDITYDESKFGYHMYDDDAELKTGLQNMSEELIQRDVRLIVVDGLVGIMRMSYEGRGELNERQIELKNVIKYLKKLSIIFNCSVIITNQVTANPDPFGAKIKPIGGHVMGHYCKYILHISKGMKNNRTIRLKKSPKSPEGDYSCFVNEEGISQYESISKKKRADKALHTDKDTKDTSLLIDEEPERLKVY